MHNGFTRVHAHTFADTRHTSGLLSGGRTRVAAYVGSVFARLWCPRAFMSWLWLFACTTSGVRKRTRALCGACKRTRTRTRTALRTRETGTRSGLEPRRITTRVQLDTRNCFSIAAGDSREPRERPTTSRFRPVIRRRERSAAQFSCFAIASSRDLCLLFWCAGISVSNRLGNKWPAPFRFVGDLADTLERSFAAASVLFIADYRYAVLTSALRCFYP